MKSSVISYLKFIYWGGYKSLTIKSMWLYFRLGSCGIGLMVKKGARVNKPQQVYVGQRVVLDRYSSIFLNQISSKKPVVRIGNKVLIGAYSSIGCSNEVVIEDDVMLAPHVHITDRNHSYEDINAPINRQPAVSQGPVVIGRDAWLGYGVQIMPNVRVGRHCVVAAGSVVTKDTPDYSVVAGIPARIVKKYNFETSQWEKVKP